jgi:hypothetical protein
MSVQKPLFLFGFREDLVSSQKPLPVHCVNSPSHHGWPYATTIADRVRYSPPERAAESPQGTWDNPIGKIATQSAT